MQKASSYKRPTAHIKARKVAPAHNQDRFEKDVLGGTLWFKECHQAGVELVEEIPLQFAGVDDYLGVFDPLILEEAREGLKADWAEACSANRTWEVEIVSIEELAEGWSNLKLRSRSGHGSLKQACPNNTSVVLTLARPPTRNVTEWAACQVTPSHQRPTKRQRLDRQVALSTLPAGDSAALSVSGGSDSEAGADTSDWAPGIVAGMARRSKDLELTVQIHPCCAAHSGSTTSCCALVLSLLRMCPKRWWIAPAKQLVSSYREFEALHHARKLDHGLLCHILQPQLLEEIGRRFEDPAVRQRMWPQQASHPAFIGYLKELYDHTQLEAIEMAACHLGARTGGLSTLPFVLIQGPPGTGKTHTVKGILNVWHLVAYQQYYDGLVQAALPSISSAAKPQQQTSFWESLNDNGSNVVQALSDSLQSTSLVQAVASTKPRILICTPSNAACDELMLRIMTDRFCDGNGSMYRPNVVRVGSEQVNASVRERWVGHLVELYEHMEQGTWQRRYGDLSHKVAHCQREIDVLEMSLSRTTDDPQQQEVLAKRLVERHQQQYRYARELERLELAREIVWGQREEWRLRDARRNIEASFLTEAEMVFTTLSSTGRQSFRQAATKAPFHTVLIDEAGQATEVASLQPLMYGAQRVVMVGDPQQLPATILSALAKEVAMERSLFERLQRQGCPVKMLSVQYRMHPEIRQFPSDHFYGGRLLDAPSIASLPDEVFYQHPVLKPYVFFDVARGQEQRRQGGGSVSNQAEAELAASLFQELRTFLIKAAQQDPRKVPRPTTVGVITPYREQRKLLQDTFARMCGKQAAAEVMIETVDSFQGKQLDVIILSCVRAGNSGGLGFVTDIRRMNVAITRAKRALWVLGSTSALRANPEWLALISDAEQRGVVIEEADAQGLFPDQPYWVKMAQKGGEGEEDAPHVRQGGAPATGAHQEQSNSQLLLGPTPQQAQQHGNGTPPTLQQDPPAEAPVDPWDGSANVSFMCQPPVPSTTAATTGNGALTAGRGVEIPGSVQIPPVDPRIRSNQQQLQQPKRGHGSGAGVQVPQQQGPAPEVGEAPAVSLLGPAAQHAQQQAMWQPATSAHPQSLPHGAANAGALPQQGGQPAQPEAHQGEVPGNAQPSSSAGCTVLQPTQQPAVQATFATGEGMQVSGAHPQGRAPLLVQQHQGQLGQVALQAQPHPHQAQQGTLPMTVQQLPLQQQRLVSTSLVQMQPQHGHPLLLVPAGAVQHAQHGQQAVSVQIGAGGQQPQLLHHPPAAYAVPDVPLSGQQLAQRGQQQNMESSDHVHHRYERGDMEGGIQGGKFGRGGRSHRGRGRGRSRGAQCRGSAGRRDGQAHVGQSGVSRSQEHAYPAPPTRR